MADLRDFLLLVVSCVIIILQFRGCSAQDSSWNASQWMQKFEEKTKVEEQTAKAVEQLTIKIHEFQQDCNTWKEAHITAQCEQKLNEQNEKHKQEQEISRIRLDNAEYRIKDEVRQQCEKESSLRVSAATLQLASELLFCKNESVGCKVDLSSCQADGDVTNSSLETCNAALQRTKTELETVNATLLNLQMDFTACETSDERREAIQQECDKQAANRSLNNEQAGSNKESCESQLKKDFTSARDAVVKEYGKVFTINNESEEKVVILLGARWHTASHLCKSIGMKLVSFQTEEKWLAIKKYLDKNGYEDRWFWTSGRSVGGKWRWSATNEVMTFSHWDEDDPEESQDICVRFRNDGTFWTYYKCSDDANFIICE